MGIYQAVSKPPLYLYLKRALDVVVALMALGLMIPLLPVVALAIKLDSPGPVFFWSRRIGRHGQPFSILKLRTMFNGAEYFQQNHRPVEGKARGVVKVVNDPRLTRLGKALRAWSLDEVPQFYQILRGDMSLVGPRPMLVDEVDLTDPLQRVRTSVPPGLTGLWQINGRSRVDFQTRLQMDVDYVERRSLGLDLMILLRTLPAVLSKDGAF